jgi:hypothetical protein
MMSAIAPQDYLIKTGKAIGLEKRTQRQQRGFRDHALTNTIKDPIVEDISSKNPNFKI